MTNSAKPFVKWAGGKRSSLDLIMEHLPPNFTRYHEPFLGGGAVFFGLYGNGLVRKADLSDINQRLITTYQAVKDNVELVVDLATEHAALNDHDHYYQARDDFAVETDPVKVAGLFIYLNRAGFNGMYRENSKGVFNVPWAGKPNSGVLTIDAENLRAVSWALRGVRLSHRPFTRIRAIADHLYYLDPPYDSGWTGYTHGGFTVDDQRAVAKFCRRIDAAKGYFLASNADTPWVRQLYDGYHIEEIMVARSINRNGAGRGKVGEVLIRNF